MSGIACIAIPVVTYEAITAELTSLRKRCVAAERISLATLNSLEQASMVLASIASSRSEFASPGVRKEASDAYAAARRAIEADFAATKEAGDAR